MVQQICSQGFQVPAPFLPSMLDRYRSESESEVFTVLLRERGALVVTFDAIADVQHDGFQSSNNSCNTGVESLTGFSVCRFFSLPVFQFTGEVTREQLVGVTCVDLS